MFTTLLLAQIAHADPAPALLIREHHVISPTRTGDPKEDYWTQFQMLGEITNPTDQTVWLPRGRIRFFGPDGHELAIDSIGTAAQKDAGDYDAGESFYAEVEFVAPGQTVPFRYLRNLAAFDGPIGSYRLEGGRGIPVTEAPRGAVVDVKDHLEGEGPFRVRVFTGTLRNDGVAPCRSPAFLVASLDAEGKVASLEVSDAVDDLKFSLASGESVPFRASIGVDAEHAWRAQASYRTWADCETAY